jgi:hypothetical protein
MMPNWESRVPNGRHPSAERKRSSHGRKSQTGDGRQLALYNTGEYRVPAKKAREQAKEYESLLRSRARELGIGVSGESKTGEDMN